VAVVLTLVQTKQIRINIHKRKKKKNTVQRIINTVNTTVLNNKLDAKFFFSYEFIPIFCMFRAPLCSSSEESIVLK
jgi:hypothetical protein